MVIIIIQCACNINHGNSINYSNVLYTAGVRDTEMLDSDLDDAHHWLGKNILKLSVNTAD